VGWSGGSEGSRRERRRRFRWRGVASSEQGLRLVTSGTSEVKELAGTALLLTLAVLVALALGPASLFAAAAQPEAAAAAKAGSPAKSKPARRRRLARLRALRAVSKIEPRALGRWPDSFGGLWLGEKGEIMIAFTHESKLRAKLLAGKLPRGSGCSGSTSTTRWRR
jgi:hypothetical protein